MTIFKIAVHIYIQYEAYLVLLNRSLIEKIDTEVSYLTFFFIFVYVLLAHDANVTCVTKHHLKQCSHPPPMQCKSKCQRRLNIILHS